MEGESAFWGKAPSTETEVRAPTPVLPDPRSIQYYSPSSLDDPVSSGSVTRNISRTDLEVADLMPSRPGQQDHLDHLDFLSCSR